MQGRIRVLLADDEKVFLVALEKRLSLRNFKIKSVTSGAEVLEEIQINPYDIVVLDWKMPGLDGWAVYTELRKIKPSIPVIFLSGHADAAFANETIKYGVDNFLFKPFSIEELISAIENACERRSIAGEMKSAASEI